MLRLLFLVYLSLQSLLVLFGLLIQASEKKSDAISFLSKIIMYLLMYMYLTQKQADYSYEVFLTQKQND